MLWSNWFTKPAIFWNIYNIIKLTILLDNLENFEKVNEIMGQLFDKPYTARAAYEVAKLPKNSSIEIETIAYQGSE